MSEIQRARILAAVTEEMALHRAESITVAHIVARAGISRRTFYELFADREASESAAFEDALVRVKRQLLAADDPRAGWLERIRAGVVAALSFLDAQRACGLLLVLGPLRVAGDALDRRRQLLAEIARFVDRGREQARAGPKLPPLTAEGVVGGALSILQARMLENPDASLMELAGNLTSTIVLPYLGPAAARRELDRPQLGPVAVAVPAPVGPLNLEMRLTYRTVRVLSAIAELSEQDASTSNRDVGRAAGAHDQGQVSKLLARLHRLGLIENSGAGQARGGPNSWALTAKGREIARALTAPESA